MASDVKLGRLIGPEAQRDAVHVAIAPVQAGQDGLRPGDWVTVGDDGLAYPGTIGIVDPFLAPDVKINKYQWFYLCLRPGTVTSIRHHWAHPAFATEERTISISDCAESEEWLRAYAIKMNPYDVDEYGSKEAFTTLIKGLQNKELFASGTDLHSLDELKNSDELKFHAERYLGIPINWSNFEFSCSC